MDQTYSNKQLSHPTPVNDALIVPSILASQTTFPLTQVDFLQMKGRPALTETWAMNFVFAAIGYALSLGPKLADWWLTNGMGPTRNEWWILALTVAISLALFLAGAALPNDRRKIFKRIGKHFDEAEVTLHATTRAKK